MKAITLDFRNIRKRETGRSIETVTCSLYVLYGRKINFFKKKERRGIKCGDGKGLIWH